MFRYLVGTKDHDILFGPEFADCVDSQKSTTGYCFKFGNGAISWKSKLQECIATSTTKAEYVAASDATKEALWLGRPAHTFRQVDSDSTPVVYSDNQSVVALLKNPVHHNASKHIDVVVKKTVPRRKPSLVGSVGRTPRATWRPTEPR